MSELNLIIVFITFGFAAGIIIGMLGIGGGVLFVPFLHMILPYSKVDAGAIIYISIATSLFAGSIASVSSAVKHFLIRNIDLKKAILLGLGSLISASITPMFVVNVDTKILKIIFIIVFMILALKMLFESAKSGNSKKYELDDRYLFLFGLVIGTIAAFVGIGGGIMNVPILIYLYNLEVKKAVGTSTLVMSLTMISSSIAYSFVPVKGIMASLQYGYVYLPAAICLGIGSSLGAMIGISIVLKTSGKIIKRIFSIILIMVIVKIIFEL